MKRQGHDKYLLVNSQRPGGVYATYADDYAAALYSYANFLLGPLDDKHGWHYGNFQCTKTHKERSGGYDYFDFQDLRLGIPTSDAVCAAVLDLPAVIAALQIRPAGHRRTFWGGVVLVAPTGRGSQKFSLTRRYCPPARDAQALSVPPAASAA